MKKYIIIALIGGFTIPAFAFQEQKKRQFAGHVQLGYQTEMPQKQLPAPPEASTAKCSTKHPK